jgi:hypothetical protein
MNLVLIRTMQAPEKKAPIAPELKTIILEANMVTFQSSFIVNHVIIKLSFNNSTVNLLLFHNYVVYLCS